MWGEEQTGFIKGRYVGTNLLTLISLLTLAEQNLDTHSSLLVSFDIEKAFDSVDWKFMELILGRYGFPQHFIDWIHTLYNKADTRILNAGFTSDPFFPTRGLRQGCCVSPLLFILMIEPLGQMMRSANFEGVAGLDDLTNFGQYADDLWTCFNDTEQNCSKLLLVTDKFFLHLAKCSLTMTKLRCCVSLLLVHFRSITRHSPCDGHQARSEYLEFLFCKACLKL